MKDKFTCPRRVEDGMEDEKSPFIGAGANLDTWNDDSCSYCGSLNQDILMGRIEDGDIELIPTDKDYKLYVRNDGGEPFKQNYRDCYTQGVENCNYNDCTHWVTRNMEETKFYFPHLSREQKMRFVELCNQKKLKIGHPGFFYRTPYFITKR